VILPFFMRFCPSGGNDANDRPSHRVSDKEHTAIDQADGVEAQFVGGVTIIELDDVHVQEHLGGRAEVETMLLPVGLRLGVVPLEVHRLPRAANILIFSRSFKDADMVGRKDHRLRREIGGFWRFASGQQVARRIRTSNPSNLSCEFVSRATWLRRGRSRRFPLDALSNSAWRDAEELDEVTAAAIADSGDDPEVAIRKKDQSEVLRKGLSRISPEHREIIDLVYYQGMAIAEIAEIVGIQENTVKTRMFYARKRLSELLGAAVVDRWP
jgi:RNA polymerase sigma factor (sigma-70 family)